MVCWEPFVGDCLNCFGACFGSAESSLAFLAGEVVFAVFGDVDELLAVWAEAEDAGGGVAVDYAQGNS